MNLSIKDIRHNRPVRPTAMGIGMLLMLVMGMGGIYRGMVEDATLLIDSVGADIWVVQRDTRGPFAEISRMSPIAEDRVAGRSGRGVGPGVRPAHDPAGPGEASCSD